MPAGFFNNSLNFDYTASWQLRAVKADELDTLLSFYQVHIANQMFMDSHYLWLTLVVHVCVELTSLYLVQVSQIYIVKRYDHNDL